MRLDFVTPFRMPVLQSRWVIMHGRTYFGVHPRRKAAGYDEQCIESQICLFRRSDDARQVARVLRAHKASCNNWPETTFDDGSLLVSADLTITTKHRPLRVSEVCNSAFEARLQAYGIGAVEVLGHEVTEGLLTMDVRPVALSSNADKIVKGLNLMLTRRA